MFGRHHNPYLFDDAAAGTGGASAPTSSTPTAPSGGNAPAASTSSSEPSSTPSSEPSSTPENADFVLPEFSDDLDSDHSVEVPADADPPGSVQPAPVAPEPAPQPAPQPQTPEPASAPQQQQPQQAPSTEGPPLDPTNPADVASFVLNNRADAEQALAQGVYALSPEEVEALETNAMEAIPKLLARTHVNVLSATLNRMGEMIPHMIQRHQQAVARNSSNADAFYAAHPHLDRNDPAVSRQVAETARIFRAQNPQATKEEMIRKVGVIVSTLAGKAPAPTPMQPAPQSFVPAGNGGAAPIPAPAPGTDLWAGLGQDFDSGD